MQNLIKVHQIVHKLLSGKELLTITKGHNSLDDLRKLTGNNPNTYLVKVNAYAIYNQIRSKIFSGNEILMITKGHNHVVIAEIDS